MSVRKRRAIKKTKLKCSGVLVKKNVRNMIYSHPVCMINYKLQLCLHKSIALEIFNYKTTDIYAHLNDSMNL